MKNLSLDKISQETWLDPDGSGGKEGLARLDHSHSLTACQRRHAEGGFISWSNMCQADGRETTLDTASTSLEFVIIYTAIVTLLEKRFHTIHYGKYKEGCKSVR